MSEVMWFELCAYCPSHWKLNQLAAFQEDGPEWSTIRRFHDSHIREQNRDNMHKHLSFTFLLVSFSCGPLLQYLVCLVPIIIVFLGWLITTTDKDFCVHSSHFLGYIHDSCKIERGNKTAFRYVGVLLNYMHETAPIEALPDKQKPAKFLSPRITYFITLLKIRHLLNVFKTRWVYHLVPHRE
jgi:hypothetical protein